MAYGAPVNASQLFEIIEDKECSCGPLENGVSYILHRHCRFAWGNVQHPPTLLMGKLCNLKTGAGLTDTSGANQHDPFGASLLRKHVEQFAGMVKVVNIREDIRELFFFQVFTEAGQSRYMGFMTYYPVMTDAKPAINQPRLFI
jgi:hypothetical protein